MPGPRPTSSLVFAELYDAGDATFLDLLLQQRGDHRPILGLIEKWKKDKRPWARKLKIEFLLGRRSPWEHRVVFKRLFKQAWHDRDHELMGAFMKSLDRSIRRKRATRYRYEGRVIQTDEVLRVPARPRVATEFSTNTKHYMRRRAWRYFRRLGFANGPEYIRAIADALVRYEDDDVRAGENLLDNWGLMHACFGKSPVITFNQRHTNLKLDGRLSDLVAAPMFERHWSTADGLPVLIDILLRAQCRPVRVWAIQLLKRLHAVALPKLDAAMLLRLIDHADPDVAEFAAGLLANAETVSSFPMTTWMQLLATRNPSVIALIVDAFRKHVNADRVTIAQAVELATRPAVPVATVGSEILERRTIRSSPDLREIAKLARAQSVAVAARIAAFALAQLNVPNAYNVDEVVALFDSNLKTMRAGAFDSLKSPSPANDDPAFWARLFESPYDDVRIELVRRLNDRADLPGASADSIASVWQSVLLNIHRGGRAKLSALQQISDRIVREPLAARTLLPILVIAIRSVRPPEARHGLAAIVSAVEQVPALADDVTRALPELQLDLTMGAVR